MPQRDAWAQGLVTPHFAQTSHFVEEESSVSPPASRCHSVIAAAFVLGVLTYRGQLL